MLELLRSQHLFLLKLDLRFLLLLVLCRLLLKLASVEKVVLHHLLGDTSRIIQLQLVPGILDDA
jgi:hypothetical protein